MEATEGKEGKGRDRARRARRAGKTGARNRHVEKSSRVLDPSQAAAFCQQRRRRHLAHGRSALRVRRWLARARAAAYW